MCLMKGLLDYDEFFLVLFVGISVIFYDFQNIVGFVILRIALRFGQT